MTPPPIVASPGQLVERVRALAGPRGDRVILGIAGKPGAGKSTLAAQLADGAGAALVPLDGFHLADDALDRLGRRDRKGAPDTFDAAGYIALLRRLAADEDDVVWAPTFHRDRELAEAGAIAVPREARLLVTEGNYLLCDGAFAQVRSLLTACWYVELDEQLRVERLVARHIANGRTPAEALAWATGPDQRNAALIEKSCAQAHLVVRVC